MKTLKNILFNRFYFMILFLISSLIVQIPILLPLQTYNKIFIIWGAIIILKDLFGKKLTLTNKGKVFLWGLCLSYFFTIILNLKGFSVSSITAFIYLALHFIIMTTYDTDMAKEQINKQIKIFCNIYISFTLMMSIIALVMFVMNFHSTYFVPKMNRIFEIGMFEKIRLQGLYSNPNDLGPASMINVMLSILSLFILNVKSKWLKGLYISSIVICFITLILTLSRGSFLSFVFFGLVFGFCFGVLFFKKKLKNIEDNKTKTTLMLYLKSSVCCILGVLVVFSCSTIVRKAMPYTQIAYNQVIEFIKNNSENNNTNKPGGTTQDKLNLDRDVGIESNGRIDLWLTGIEVWKTNPVFGVGFQRGFDVAKNDLNMESAYLNINGGFHNIYVQSLVDFGLVGLLLFMAYILIIVFKSIRYVFTVKQVNKESYIVITLISILASLLFFGVIDYLPISPGNFVSITFFGVIGFLTYYLEKHAIENGYYKPSFIQKMLKKKTSDIKIKGE